MCFIEVFYGEKSDPFSTLLPMARKKATVARLKLESEAVPNAKQKIDDELRLSFATPLRKVISAVISHFDTKITSVRFTARFDEASARAIADRCPYLETLHLPVGCPHVRRLV